MAIIEQKAVILKNDGQFVNLPAQPHWQKGDVITLSGRSRERRPLYILAACFALLTLLSIGGSHLYFTETALVSIDVNPAIELKLNGLDRVIAVTTYNDEGQEIVSALKLRHHASADAVALLLTDDAWNRYLAEEEAYVMLTVQCADQAKEARLLSDLQQMAQVTARARHPAAQVDCRAVDQELVMAAHAHQVTAGKYLALLALREVAPDVQIDDYTHRSISAIKTQTALCQNAHSPNTAQTPPDAPMDATTQVRHDHHSSSHHD